MGESRSRKQNRFPMTYIVTRSECAFQYEMEEAEDVLDFQEEHRAQYGERHILEFEMVH